MQKIIKILSGILCISMLLIIAYQQSFLFSGLRNSDYLPYWLANNVFEQGLSPLDPNNLVKEIPETLNQIPARDVGIVYSLPVIYFFTSLIFTQDYYVSAAILFLIILAASFISIIPPPREMMLLKILFLFSFPPFLITFLKLQVSVLLLIGVGLFLFFIKKSEGKISSTYLGGLSLAVASYKPQLLVLILFGILLSSIREKSCKTLIGFTGGFLFLSLFAEFVSPGIYKHYLESLNVADTLKWQMPNLSSLIVYLGRTDVFYTNTFVIILGLLIMFFLERNVRGVELAYLAVLLSPIFSSYVWTYDYLMILPAMIWLINQVIMKLSSEGIKPQNSLSKFCSQRGWLIFGLMIPINILFCIIPSMFYFVFYSIIFTLGALFLTLSKSDFNHLKV